MTIELTIEPRTRDLGGGFQVARLLPWRRRRMVGPFIFYDQMGPMELAPGIPQELDIRPHPHIGLSTVTYLYSGALTHRDSVGSHQEITPGAVNWMTAGCGITHSERLEQARSQGALMHGVQSWVALPEEVEETEPAFSHHPAAELPSWAEGGVQGRLIAGEMDGLQSPVRTHSPLFYQHLTLQPGARHGVSATYSERAVHVVSGQAELDGQRLTTGQMVVLAPGREVILQATTPAVVMLLGGEPIGQRYIFWNFVSSSEERLQEASLDWQEGRMKLPTGDDQEFVPLPEGWS